jgi:predicted flap endonuclease-1-like 5' DNA nuclease
MAYMKKVAKLLGFVGGVAAVLWAMRDRLVSIAAPKEPEPPRFRVADSSPSVDDLTTLTGIGPVFAARLAQSGISTFAALAAAGPEVVAKATGITSAKATDWIEQASARV